MQPSSQTPTAVPAPQPGSTGTTTSPEIPFGVNEVRLDARQWLIAFGLLALIVALTPTIWERLERFDTGADYRIPYPLSNDYWLYGRRLRQVTDARQVVLLGDSVVWGEYVAPDGTLSHFLNQETGGGSRFINGGVNGLFPLAEQGLFHYYGGALRNRQVILQCNVLWQTSPKVDLSAAKEDQFNHSRLVPQFFPQIPCYRAEANERLSALAQRQIGFLAWVVHLQQAYFGQKSILGWTLEDDGGTPAHYPRSWKNPLAQITLAVPSAPRDDPQRGPASPRHKPWSEDHTPTRFEWVDLDASLQWQAFRLVVEDLRARGNDVLVVLGPFNEHMLVEDNRPAYRKVRDGIVAWLEQNRVPHLAPDTLPSALYADASHPLTQGYALLAQRLYADPGFKAWLEKGKDPQLDRSK